MEVMRCENGARMAREDREAGTLPEVDYVCGVPDSGTPHAIGYSNESGIPFARAFIKYTPTWPRSFMPQNQNQRNHVAKMKLIPVKELIAGKKLLFVDDSIVRGTQLRETVESVSYTHLDVYKRQAGNGDRGGDGRHRRRMEGRPGTGREAAGRISGFPETISGGFPEFQAPQSDRPFRRV